MLLGVTVGDARRLIGWTFEPEPIFDSCLPFR
jgi:hypothetical protein